MTSLGNEMYERFSRERKISQTKGDTPPWYTTGGYIMFKQKYLFEAKSIKEQFQRIAATAAKHSKLPGANKMFFNMLWDGILSPSTPVLSNMGTRRGFPISCAGSYVGDSVDSFYKSRHEVAMLTKMGFGTSAYLGDIRKRGSPFKGNGKASGVAPLLQGFVQDMSLVSQGSNRRGAFAGYLPVTHGDFDEVCDMLMATPDDLNIGWIIPDSFVDKLNKKDEDALRRYKKILKAKMITGKGYLWFSDKANRKLPQSYKEKGLTNKASNLCSEILLPSDDDYTYSCVLSSLNLVHWDKIKSSLGTDKCYVMWATEFLNCVIDEFLEQSKGYPGFEKIHRFTSEFRAIGLGVCGYHTLLLNKRVPWESLQANWLNMEIFEALNKHSFVEGRFNASRIAVAPTKSTALLMGGVSEGINPMPAYTFTQATAAGNVDRIEPVLLDLAKERCDNIEAEIAKISAAFGSVQDVDWLTDEEKKVFKTAFEINQHSVVRHASMRSDLIDQWQSVNLFFSSEASEKYVSAVFKEAMLNPKIIGLYYAYTLTGVKGSTGECESCM
jgi:ribonucleoside-diphosphate reductase alpha chain